MPVFRPFGPDHWAVLGLTGLTLVGLVASTRRLRRRRNDRTIRLGLAAGLVGTGVISWLYAVAKGVVRLPLQLCDVAIVLVAWALIGKSRCAKEVACCWGLAGSSQAILTPDLAHGFPSAPWLTFFVTHCGVVLSAVYLVVSGRVRLTTGSVWRVWWFSNLYVVVVGVINWGFGTNFGYLARKPQHPSLLDYLGPWPWYLVSVEVIGLASFFLCYRFSRAVERWATQAV